MALVRSHGNKRTELRMASLLRAYGLRGWRRRIPVFGKPDFVWRVQRVVLFVDGCFWHGCPRHSRIPKTRKAFWVPKLAHNKARDAEVNSYLKQARWKVVRIWECELGDRALGRRLSWLKLLFEVAPSRIPSRF